MISSCSRLWRLKRQWCVAPRLRSLSVAFVAFTIACVIIANVLKVGSPIASSRIVRRPQQASRFPWRAIKSVANTSVDLGRTGRQSFEPPVTAEQVEHALGGGDGAIDGLCAWTAGGWCEAYLNQPLLEMPLKPPPDKLCPGGGVCNENGVCNADTGQARLKTGQLVLMGIASHAIQTSCPLLWCIIAQCFCPAWWDGPDCSTPQLRKCQSRNASHPAASCPGYCDERLAHCYCPTSTPYGGIGGRHIVEGCKPNHYDLFQDNNGFTRLTAEAWDRLDPPPPKGTPLPGNLDPAALYGDPSMHEGVSTPGWCVAAPGIQVAATSCGCVYDGSAGRYCEIPTLHTCLLDCSGRGRCEHGFCWCEPGYFGIGCERISTAKHAELAALEQQATLKQQRRPLIYIYDLPKMFNLQIFQYRVDKKHCFHRHFDAFNASVWTHGAGYLEPELHEALLGSKHRTLDPELADFFYVPLYLTCFIWPVAYYADHPRGREPNRNQAPRDLVLGALEHIRSSGPYWDRNGGRDFVWFFSHDEGACWAPADIWSGVMLSFWGRSDLFASHPVSSSAFGPDNFDNSHEALRIIGNHPCFDPDKDIVMPPFVYYPHRRASTLSRDVFFFFAGNDGSSRACVTPSKCYSRGVRQKIHRLLSNTTGFTFQVRGSYSSMLSRSVFCLVAAGDGFSTRMEDAILHGCIPVIIIDQTLSAWGTLLNTQAFSVRIPESMIPKLEDTLRAIPADVIKAKQAAVKAVLSRFEWTDLYRFPRVADSGGMGALETLMGALYYKMLTGGGARGVEPPPFSRGRL